MQNKYFMVLLIAGILLSSGSLFARDNKMEFGVGLQLGYFYPELSDHIGNNYFMESQDDVIFGLNATYGFTSHFWGQVLAEYYNGNMDYDIRTSYSETTVVSGRKVTTNYVLNYDAKADLTTIPISLNIGYSFLKEGKLDPYVSLGPTFFSTKVDSTEAKGKLFSVGDFVEDQTFVANKDLDLDSHDDNTIGLNAGFGFNYFPSNSFKSFALCADARYYWGQADFDLDNSLDVGGLRLSAGFKFVFGGSNK
jgi:hypothetical protein